MKKMAFAIEYKYTNNINQYTNYFDEWYIKYFKKKYNAFSIQAGVIEQELNIN